LEIAQGVVALDSTEPLTESYAAKGLVAWGQIMVHEIGHAVGLAHTDARDQQMYGVATTANARLGKGDLRGFELVGLGQGCWDQGAR
uniref:matrixin family metalloprotease n=1 Tax=Nocardioides sp. TaxID=35761 RepID=UPI002B266E98